MPAHTKNILTQKDIEPFLNGKNKVLLELHGECYNGWVKKIIPSSNSEIINSFDIAFKLLVRFQMVEKPLKNARIVLNKYSNKVLSFDVERARFSFEHLKRNIAIGERSVEIEEDMLTVTTKNETIKITHQKNRREK